MNTLIIYHADCSDGFCAAWVARKAITPKLGEHDSLYFLPAYHGDPLPNPMEYAGKDVYILDFSYKGRQLEEICKHANRVVLLDHHETAEKELADFQGKISIVFDKSKSGARLTWEHFFHDTRVPWLVRYTEDRDLWKWQLIDSKPVNANLRSHLQDFDLWDTLETLPESNRIWGEFVDEGKAILRDQERVITSLAYRAYEIELAGHKVLCLNTPIYQSEIGAILAEDRPFGATYFETATHRIYSLRSTEQGINVAEVAKQFGGGGHAHAAGFKIKNPYPSLVLETSSSNDLSSLMILPTSQGKK